ncbi:uncharacterized protein LOC123535149 [Mercenaria mercenaria]|uniref:uncharacterized protein LOC123535149 n=1 Tax=Mercenaria mercenaria TaxID=6596 RepID=UPI00234FA619|nr:uncharacterized protein LOC123535149 [Mercenaria mercenaria]
MACCDVILYYIQWCVWSAYQCILRCICSLCCCERMYSSRYCCCERVYSFPCCCCDRKYSTPCCYSNRKYSFPSCCCEGKYRLYLYDYETVNFANLFEKWADKCFEFDLWTPQSSYNTQQLIMVVCEEKARMFADMSGALENFTDEQLKQTVFVYITGDVGTKISVPEGDRFSTVPIVYISKEKSWRSATIFRKACAYLVKLANLKTPSEQTPLT